MQKHPLAEHAEIAEKVKNKSTVRRFQPKKEILSVVVKKVSSAPSAPLVNVANGREIKILRRNIMEKEHLQVILESIDGKFDLVLEGHAALDQKIDRKFDQLDEKIELCNFKIDTLNDKIDVVDENLGKKIDAVAADLKATDKRLSSKIDAVAADLRAHRADTEAHHGVYRVKESWTHSFAR